MRTIRFRGIHSETEMWVCGDLVHDKEGRPMIAMLVENRNIYGDYVIPDTVGQFTGLIDRNGVEICEGDILRWNTCDIKVVRWFLSGWTAGNDVTSMDLYDFISKVYCCIIGNVHDNPELLNQ